MIDVEEERGLARIAMEFAKLAGATEIGLGVSVYDGIAIAKLNVVYCDGVKVEMSVKDGDAE